MSRGPGRIERAVEALFDAERDNAFTLEELCERIYGVRRITRVWNHRPPIASADLAPVLGQKHRNAVTRAVRKVAGRQPEIQTLRGENRGRPLVVFRHDEVLSYAMARLKADGLNHYRSGDPRDEQQLREMLGDARHQELITPGGAWWRYVQIFLAERDGDADRLARLKDEVRADLISRGYSAV